MINTRQLIIIIIVLITGCSSGFGVDIARHFLERGWRVVATMRVVNNDVLPAHGRLSLLPLDVTNNESIMAAFAAAGDVDVLVNNAGIGLVSAFEATPMASVHSSGSNCSRFHSLLYLSLR